MTKQEQIEQMAKIIDDRLTEANLWLGSMNKGKGYWIAEKLVEHYQPKLSEDSVVLSKEEYEDYKKHVDNCVEEYHRGQHEAELYYKNIQIPRECKETAKKIYTKIKDSFLMDSKSRYKLKLWLKEQFGVDIYE